MSDLVGFRAVNKWGAQVCSWAHERAAIDGAYLDAQANAISAIHAFGIDGIGIATRAGDHMWRVIVGVKGVPQFVTLSSDELALSIRNNG